MRGFGQQAYKGERLLLVVGRFNGEILSDIGVGRGFFQEK